MGQPLLCEQLLALQEIVQSEQGLHCNDGLRYDLHRLTTLFIEHPHRNHPTLFIRQQQHSLSRTEGRCRTNYLYQFTEIWMMGIVNMSRI